MFVGFDVVGQRYRVVVVEREHPFGTLIEPRPALSSRAGFTTPAYFTLFP